MIDPVCDVFSFADEVFFMNMASFSTLNKMDILTRTKVPSSGRHFLTLSHSFSMS